MVPKSEGQIEDLAVLQFSWRARSVMELAASFLHLNLSLSLPFLFFLALKAEVAFMRSRIGESLTSYGICFIRSGVRVESDQD